MPRLSLSSLDVYAFLDSNSDEARSFTTYLAYWEALATLIAYSGLVRNTQFVRVQEPASGMRPTCRRQVAQFAPYLRKPWCFPGPWPSRPRSASRSHPSCYHPALSAPLPRPTPLGHRPNCCRTGRCVGRRGRGARASPGLLRRGCVERRGAARAASQGVPCSEVTAYVQPWD